LSFAAGRVHNPLTSRPFTSSTGATLTSDQQQKPSLLDRARHHIRFKHYSSRTEEAYVQAARRFILFHKKRHPLETGGDEVRQYLSHLANEERVSAPTRNQALAALLFLYREVLGTGFPFVGGMERAKRG
jgi:hypothetical protein